LPYDDNNLGTRFSSTCYSNFWCIQNHYFKNKILKRIQFLVLKNCEYSRTIKRPLVGLSGPTRAFLSFLTLLSGAPACFYPFRRGWSFKLFLSLVDCKTVVFGRFRKARSAVSRILACEAREPRTPVRSVRRENVSPHSPSPFSHSLQTALRSQKNTTVLQSISLEAF